VENFENNWRARYDRWAGQHTADHMIAGWSELGLSRRLALVLRVIAAHRIHQGCLILDLGSGPGTYTRSLTGLGYRCVGVDYSYKVAKLAQNKDRSGTYLQGEAYHLPFRSDRFDALICVGVLQSLQSIDEAVAEMRRVLRPGGYLFLDGLNSFFWLHAVRSINELVRRLPSRMRYYNPVRLAGMLEHSGLSTPRLHWLAVPELAQKIYSLKNANRSLLLSLLFGHAFLIVAQKPVLQTHVQ